MRILAIILFTLSIIGPESKLPIGVWDANILYGENFDWANFDHIISDQEKEEYLRQLFEYDGTAYMYRMEILYDNNFEDFKRIHSKNIHFIDLDEDGDKDVIYDGVAGGYEMGFVHFYNNEQDILTLVHREHGRIFHGNVSEGEFRIQKYPCCDQKLNILKKIKLDSENCTVNVSESIDIFVGRGVEMGDSILPPFVNIGTPFKMIEAGELRWSPNTSDFDQMNTCENSRSNIISHLPKGSEGEVLWKSKKSTWVFVRIFDTKGITNFCRGWGDEIEKAKNINTYGWIKN